MSGLCKNDRCRVQPLMNHAHDNHVASHRLLVASLQWEPERAPNHVIRDAVKRYNRAVRRNARYDIAERLNAMDD